MRRDGKSADLEAVYTVEKVSQCSSGLKASNRKPSD